MRYLKTWHLVAILLAGTAIRFAYGYSSKAWLGSPDQLAWGLSIDEMLNNRVWSYTQLTYAPHEGGSFFISLLSILFRSLQFILPPLSFAALVIDTAGRLIQIKITQKLFGNEAAFWFGIWTILSIPLLIPWATVNFGLHALFSFVPFVFFYFVIKYKENKYLPVVCGIVAGVAVSFSYDSLLLIVTSGMLFLAAAGTLKSRLVKLFTFLIIFTLTVLPHIFSRDCFKTELSLTESASILSIRGVPLDNLFTLRHCMNLCLVWFTSLPGSFLLSSIAFFSPVIICLVVFLFLLAGVLLYLTNPVTKIDVRLLPVSIVFLFMAAYAFSPFYGKDYGNTSYVYYRHLGYIVPFVTVIMISGFLRTGKWKTYVLTAWIFLCGAASFQYMIPARKVDQPAYRAAGWILAQKYGADMNKLFQMHAVTGTEYRHELLLGFGWGVSAAILRNKNDQASIDKLIGLIREWPEKYRQEIIEGVYYSFRKGITPVLDQALPAILDTHLKKVR